MSDTPAHKAIDFHTVHADELKSLEARWDAAYPGDARGQRLDSTQPAPTAANTLVGLGMSGGGIRSATFNLGILQALHRRGVFDHVDYMSTVSGGGYLGSAISTVMRKEGTEFPFVHTEGVDESPYLSWLRNHSNYMVENGLMDWLRIMAILVRGILLNILVLVPGLLAATLGFTLLYKTELTSWVEAGRVLAVDAYQVTPWVVLGALVYVLAYPPVIRIFKVVTHRRSTTEEARSESSVGLRNLYELSFGALIVIVGGALVLETLPLVLHHFHRWHIADGSKLEAWTGGAGLLSIVGTAGASKLSESLTGGWATKLVTPLVGIFGAMLPLLLILFVGEALAYETGTVHALLAKVGEPWQVVAVAAVVIWVFTHLTLDINLTSVHGMYRDRLASAYLVGRNTDDEIDIEEDVNFFDLNQPGSKAPYHLINTAMNLQGSDDPFIRERGSDFFVFSNKYAGSERTGYVSTRDIESVFPQMDVATGMAISAAAASPNMGQFTRGTLVPLMTLLNIRLGYWVPNPAKLHAWAEARRPVKSTLGGRMRWRVRPQALIREMFSRLTDAGTHVNLSDGGHIENLAGIELLRRRCKYVIIGDGEADGDFAFQGLAVLMRFARLDLGVEIDILVDDLHLDDGKSRRHAAFGRIWYPPTEEGGEPEEGRLLYIKLSYSGDEDEVIKHYRATHPTFPHQTTADQFFDEGQFEAYRSLGYHVADELFAPLPRGARKQDLSFGAFERWFADLEAALAPRRASEALADELQSELLEIEKGLQPAGDGLEGTIESDALVTARQLNLMVRAHSALGLDKALNRDHAGNSGWMTLFRSWADDPTFQESYRGRRYMFSRTFQIFVEDILGVGGPVAPE